MVHQPHITNLETGNRVHFAEWIPVSESLPDDDIVVLIACSDADGPVWLGFHEDEIWVNIEGRDIQSVTHWMPLPEPPRR